MDKRHKFPRLCRNLSELSPQPMVAVEGVTHIVRYVNPAFCRLVGKEAKELIGHRFAEAVPEGEQNGCLALLDHVYQTGQPKILAEQEHWYGQTPPIYWSYSVWAILGANELPEGVMIQVTEATEAANFRKQVTEMNQALMHSSMRQHELTEAEEKLNASLRTDSTAKDNFIAMSSHELRNPLGALRLGLQIFKQARDNPSLADQTWAVMDRQLNQLGRLVEDLLDASRITSGKLNLRKERVELAAVLQNAVETSRPLIDQLGHELTIALPAEPIPLDGDPLRLAQVFTNLLNNAAKYSEKGAKIWLTAERQGDEAVVSVKDTGIGIPAVHLSHIFEMFSQVEMKPAMSQSGLGIGLSLVKGLVERHGGSIEAFSEGTGKGSKFVVRLPVFIEMTSP